MVAGCPTFRGFRKVGFHGALNLVIFETLSSPAVDKQTRASAPHTKQLPMTHTRVESHPCAQDA